MDLQALKNLKTELLDNDEKFLAACRLSRYYNYRPIKKSKLLSSVKSDLWCQAELLTDINIVPKENYEVREAVAFLYLRENNVRKTSPISTDLYVTCFATQPFFDIEVAAKWADFRIGKACEFLNRIHTIKWDVNEYDLPLQVQLRELGYKMDTFDKELEELRFIK